MEDLQIERPKTPIHLWIVGGIALLMSGMGSFDYIATVTRFEPYLSGFPQAFVDYIFAQPLWMFVIWAVGNFCGLLGAINLLMRRKWAVPLFGIAASAVATSAIGSLMSPIAAPEGAGNSVMSIAAIGLTTLFFVYAFRMSRRGVLR